MPQKITSVFYIYKQGLNVYSEMAEHFIMGSAKPIWNGWANTVLWLAVNIRTPTFAHEEFQSNWLTKGNFWHHICGSGGNIRP